MSDFIGLPDKTERILNSLRTPDLVFGKDTEGFVISNLSGDLSRGTVRETPTEPLDPVNKAYVDAIAGGGATTGAGPPGSAPSIVGSFYVDTTNLVLYVAMNTNDSSDWKAVISQ